MRYLPQNPQHMVNATLSLHEKQKLIFICYTHSTRRKNKAVIDQSKRPKAFTENQKLVPKYNNYSLLCMKPESFHGQSGADRWDVGGEEKKEEEERNCRDNFLPLKKLF